MSTLNDDIHRDLYEKVNLNTIAVNSLSAEVRNNNDHFDKVIALIENDMKRRHREIMGLVMFAFFCVGVIAYGAIGKDGMFMVRQTIPAIANGQTGAPIDGNDDGRRAER